MTLPRTVNQAMSYLSDQIKNGKPFKSGLCKLKTREAYLIESDGSPDAATSWRRTKHRFSGVWMRGAFVYWTGGSEGNGHVAMMSWRKVHSR
jgi:hypothetical protein